MGEIEHQPNPERLTDEQIINQALDKAARDVENIPPAIARMIASQLHGGQASALYSFASTGTVDYEGMSAELNEYIKDDSHELYTWAAWLHSYALDHQEQTEPVAGFHKLWAEAAPGMERMARLVGLSEDELKEHITNPISPEEAGEELTRRLGERGLMWVHYLSDEGHEIWIRPQDEDESGIATSAWTDDDDWPKDQRPEAES